MPVRLETQGLNIVAMLVVDLPRSWKRVYQLFPLDDLNGTVVFFCWQLCFLQFMTSAIDPPKMGQV